RVLPSESFGVKLVGVILSIILVYIVGVFVGNFIGRALWRLAEMAVMRIPLVRAIYPAVKQVTDFVLAERSGQFEASRVVAVKPAEGKRFGAPIDSPTAPQCEPDEPLPGGRLVNE